MRSHVLSTIASGTASSWEGLMDFLGSTFFAHQANIVGIEEAATNILEFLEKEGMIKTGPDQTIQGHLLRPEGLRPLHRPDVRGAHAPGLGEV